MSPGRAMIVTVGAIPRATVLADAFAAEGPPAFVATTLQPSEFGAPLSASVRVYVRPVPSTRPVLRRTQVTAKLAGEPLQVPTLQLTTLPATRAVAGRRTDGAIRGVGTAGRTNDAETVVVMPFEVADTEQPIRWPACDAVASVRGVPALALATPSTVQRRTTLARFGRQASPTQRTLLPNFCVPLITGCLSGAGGGVS